jgi:ABC-type dipeptide/oligopeptide/nickel transport system permease component
VNKPLRWYFVPLRTLFVTFILTLLAFAISLFLSILEVVISARARGVHPDMRIAYRHFALPAALVVGAMVLVVATMVEIRHYRQAKALADIARASR